MKSTRKNHYWTGLAVSLVVLTCQPAAIARDGTHGGNGDAPREEQLRQLRADVGPRLHVGSPLTAVELPQLDDWCDRVTRFLKNQRRRALTQMVSGQRELAIQTLHDALDAAAQSIEVDGRRHSPITKIMIERGQKMANAVDELVKETSDDDTIKRYRETEVRFLVSYLGFVIETDRELDRPLYVPYLFNPKIEPMAELEQQYLKFAKGQLAYVNGTFTKLVERDGDFIGLPIGEPKVYLTLAQIIAGGVADDLDGTLARYADSCAIGDLRDISNNLQDYLNGDPSLYRYDAYAVDTVRDEIHAVDDRIDDRVCGRE